MNKQSYRSGFQKDVLGYEQITQSKYIKIIYSLEKEVIAKFLKGIKSDKLSAMDFACGSGRWTTYLEGYFDSITGVDVSGKMIELAKGKCKKAKFCVKDITKESQKPTNRYDVITAFRFYKNAEDDLRKDATKRLEDYLDSGGYFIFDLHLNTFSFMGVAANLMKILRINKVIKINDYALRTISLMDIKHLFRNSSFEIVDYYGMGFLPSRSNHLILPEKMLYRFERFLMRNKWLRPFSYNLLVIARKR